MNLQGRPSYTLWLVEIAYYETANQNSSKGKTKVFTPNRKDSSSGRFTPSQPRKEFFNQVSHSLIGPQVVNSVFKEPIYRVLGKIKNKLYFKWSNRMGGDRTKRNQNLCYHYHQDRGYTTKDCRTLQAFLDQLIKAGKLKQFLQQSDS